MNRETSFSSSDTLVVVDRSKRRRNIIIAAVVGIASWSQLPDLLRRRRGTDGRRSRARSGRRTGPTVTVVVPGRTQVARTIAAIAGGPRRHARRRRRRRRHGGRGAGPAGPMGPGRPDLAVIDRTVQARTAQQLAAQVQVARADAALAQNEYERSQSLVGRGFVSKADLDRKRAARDAANARVRVAEASLAETRARIGRLDIRSPAAGLVLERNVEPGQVEAPDRAHCSGWRAAAKWSFAPS